MWADIVQTQEWVPGLCGVCTYLFGRNYEDTKRVVAFWKSYASGACDSL